MVILVDVDLRETFIDKPFQWMAKNLQLSPLAREEALSPKKLTSLSQDETYAEKIRAALTRRTPAIRDFFDIDYSVNQIGLKLNDPKYIDMVKAKLSVVSDLRDVSEGRLVNLKIQIEK